MNRIERRQKQGVWPRWLQTVRAGPGWPSRRTARLPVIGSDHLTCGNWGSSSCVRSLVTTWGFIWIIRDNLPFWRFLIPLAKPLCCMWCSHRFGGLGMDLLGIFSVPCLSNKSKDKNYEICPFLPDFPIWFSRGRENLEGMWYLGSVIYILILGGWPKQWTV